MNLSSKHPSTIESPNHAVASSQTNQTIQRHGVLLACSIEDKRICYASDNTRQLFSEDAVTLLNKPIDAVVDKEVLNKLLSRLEHRSLAYEEIQLNQQDVTLIIHKRGELLLLEFEINTVSLNPFKYQMRLTESVSEVKTISDIPGKIHSAISTVKKYLGYDRVVVYQLDAEGNGCLTAELKEKHLDSWLGLRFPASDFSQDEHQLYLKKRVRIVSNASDKAVAILSCEHQTPTLDLSHTQLRTLTPLHLKRLNSLKVLAKLTVAIVHDNSLWGLMIGYHYSPKYINFYQRLNCEYLAQALGTDIYLVETSKALAALKKSAATRIHLIDQINVDKNISVGLSQHTLTINDLTNSHGAAIYIDGKVTTVGLCPTDEEIIDLIKNIKPLSNDRLYRTHCLQNDFPEAEAYRGVASGVLCLFISVKNNAALLWFKPEVIKTVSWTRNLSEPDKMLTTCGNLQSSKGKALKQWPMLQKGTSEAWEDYETSEGVYLQKNIRDILIANYDEIRTLNDRLTAAYEEMESFSYSISHDLRAPLRGIDGFAHILKEDCYQDLSDFGKTSLDTIITSATKMNQLIDNILEYSSLSKTSINTEQFSIDAIIKELLIELEPTYSHVKVIVEPDLPDISGDRMLVLTLLKNLLENAMKYSAEGQHPEVKIGCIGSQTFFVQDNGMGFDMKYHEKIFGVFERLVNSDYPGSGIGLAIAKRVVDKHHGKIWVESQINRGSTFYFQLAET